MASELILSQLKKIKPSAKNVIDKYKEVFEQALKELKTPEELREGAETFLGASEKELERERELEREIGRGRRGERERETERERDRETETVRGRTVRGRRERSGRVYKEYYIVYFKHFSKQFHFS